MDLEKMKAVRIVLDQLVENEQRRAGAVVLVLSSAEREQILDQRKKKLIDELRSHGVAQLADAKPAPPKAPALSAALEEARAAAKDPTDPCAESRRVPA